MCATYNQRLRGRNFAKLISKFLRISHDLMVPVPHEFLETEPEPLFLIFTTRNRNRDLGSGSRQF
jgi:hypothetical protein